MGGFIKALTCARELAGSAEAKAAARSGWLPFLAREEQSCDTEVCQRIMSLQEQYDEAMFAFSQGDFDGAIVKFREILAQEPAHFDAQLGLGMAFYRKGDFSRAIEEGHKAEKLKPHEQLVHTNLSLFYMKSGDKKTAEHHGLQARIASWREPVSNQTVASSDPDLQLAKPPPPQPAKPVKLPDMPWKKNKPLASPASTAAEQPSAPEKSNE